MRIPPRRTLSVLAVAATVVLTATSCGGGTSSQHPSADAKTAPGAATSPSASADPFAGETANQILTGATASLASADSVKVAGTMKQSGGEMSIDLYMVKNVGCQGSIGMGSQGTVTMVALGKTVWEKLDQATLAGAVGKDEAAALKGKYFKTTSTAKDFQDLQSFCDLNTFAKGMANGSDDTYSKGAVTSTGGQQVLTLVDTKDHSSVLVSLTAPHRVLRAMGATPADGSITIGYDLGSKITPPPASEVVDASKYGM
ncbi:hypothetical protein [Streptacidiphilus anmyonensis]|uniref:hypothetical protein n=1 Tax=Streptacidiphilus anmyonensis TaxID=405782 RepID=UPI0005A9E632|nr:hypothetical protein [Streptacidiphilus anmyonensis]